MTDRTDTDGYGEQTVTVEWTDAIGRGRVTEFDGETEAMIFVLGLDEHSGHELDEVYIPSTHPHDRGR